MTAVGNAREGGDDRTDFTDESLRKSDLSSEIYLISLSERRMVRCSRSATQVIVLHRGGAPRGVDTIPPTRPVI
jgi:hypothetical protein